MYNYNFYVTRYEGRVLLLVENTSKKLSALFYRSTGSANPDIKKSGEVFPILGILNEGKLGTDMNKHYSHMNNGWIIKAVTNDGRKDIKSYFNSESLRSVCLRLERSINENANEFGNYNLTKLSFNDWIAKVDEFYISNSTNFFPSKLLRLYKEKVNQ